MPMQPPFREKPLWYHGLLLVTLIACSFVLTSLFTLIVPLIYHIPLSEMTGSGHSPGFIAAMRLDQLIGSVGIMLVPSLLFYRLTQPEPWGELGLKPSNSGWYYPLAVIIVILSIPMVQVLAEWNQHLHLPRFLSGLDKWMRDTEQDNDALINRLLTMPRITDLLANLLVMALIPALCEEAFFRGVLQKLFVKATHSPVAGILIGAAVFSALHGQFLGFFSRMALGVVLGCLFWYSGSLWPGIAAHFAYNGVQVLYFYIQQQQSGLSSSPFFDDKAVMPLSYGLISTVLVAGGLILMKRLAPASIPTDKPSTWP
jgi:membrane protease YdiL (CAAX protease family)